MLANPYQKYRQNQVETVSPQKLIVMLYSGAIKFLKLAQAGLAEKNLEKTHQNIVKTQDIIFELMNSLDLEKGEVAHNLHALYDYMHTRLVEANLKKQEEPLQEVEQMMTELRDAWAQVIHAT
ncbi:flagellar export chaperone FliS [Dethiobacter alkaliphilus]|uniref:flagellar export chaperone FliS n=1 Tax=Dethiobacter alkaliphilus TaxID=427926 RepID=UPI002227DB0E|nr:flagellar export chaperone FliS [Dethiobacter alkaliphilus]MCW3488755.1 flagellar export chaperone FliS [Dethiobacter alkaliphilus]